MSWWLQRSWSRRDTGAVRVCWSRGVVAALAALLRNGDAASRSLTLALAPAFAVLVFFGAVVDFLDFYWRAYHWPAFNAADASISVGVVLLALRMLAAPAPSR